MRMIFGVLSLLFVVALIAFMAKKQVSSINGIKVPGATASSTAPSADNPGNVQQQSQQIQQQFKAAAEAAMQPARAEPETK